MGHKVTLNMTSYILQEGGYSLAMRAGMFISRRRTQNLKSSTLRNEGAEAERLVLKDKISKVKDLTVHTDPVPLRR